MDMDDSEEGARRLYCNKIFGAIIQLYYRNTSVFVMANLLYYTYSFILFYRTFPI